MRAGFSYRSKLFLGWEMDGLRFIPRSHCPRLVARRQPIGPSFTSPDTLIATSQGQNKFRQFDFRSGKWLDFASSKDKLVSWIVSPDGKYFFYATGGKDPRMFRIRLKDRLMEEIVGLKEIHTVDDPYIHTKLNVTPDNSPLLTQDVSTQEVYSIALK